jgi:beta-glucosidase
MRHRVLGVLVVCAALVSCHGRSSAAQAAAVSSGDARVDALLAQMTLPEKILLIHGQPEPHDSDQGQAGYIPGLARLGIPPLRLSDGPPGVLTRYTATALPATMALAATFSVQDAERSGVVIGTDARALGIDVVLEPYINLHRDQTFHRAYNTYGEDPLLTGVIGAGVIRGIQAQGIMAQAKHYVGYDGANDVTLDTQTLHEIYLAPFAAAAGAGVSSVMCSYNLINGPYSCGNADTLATLRNAGFDGFVTSDWGAVHATGFINAGLDLEMPGSGTGMSSYFEAELPGVNTPRVRLAPPVLTTIPEEPAASYPPGPAGHTEPPQGMLSAVHAAQVDEATITRAAGHILKQMDRFGLLGRTGARPVSPLPPGTHAEAERALARDAAVLLKNEGHALPLSAADLGSTVFIGPGAGQTIATGISGEKSLGFVERQIGTVTALQRDPASKGAHPRYLVADDMDGRAIPAACWSHESKPGLARKDAGGERVDPILEFTRANGHALPTGSSAEWSGTLRVPAAGRYRLYLQVIGASGSLSLDGQVLARTAQLQLHGNVLQAAQDNVLPTTDGLDNVRRELELSAGAHQIGVKIEGDASGSPVQVRLRWVTPEQVQSDYRAAVDAAKHASRAVVFVWSRNLPAFALPGDQDKLVADVARANPNTIVVMNVSEPVALPWLDRVKALLLMWYPGDEGGPATADVLLGHANPAGRLPITWPAQLAQNVANDPAHPERSSLGVGGRTQYSEGVDVGYRWFDQQQRAPQFPFGFGLSYTAFDYSNLYVKPAGDGGLDVAFDLRNGGGRDGDEVPQVYLGQPLPAPAGAQFAPQALAAFDRVHLSAGQTRHLQLHVASRALEYWSAVELKWVRAFGTRAVSVGASSRDLKLTVNSAISAAATTP